jgi:AcrR family transcriptional regulator
MAPPRRQQASGRRRRRTQTGGSLSKDVYIDAAVNLIEKRGADNLSARTLGAAVGADASALYRYFTSVDDVLRAVADRLIGIALERWTPSEDWLTSFADLGRELHQVYVREYPKTGYAVASHYTGLPNETRAVELSIGLLRDGGFEAEYAARLFRSLSDFLRGQAMIDGAFSSLPSDVQQKDHAAWKGIGTGSSGSEAPHTETAVPDPQSPIAKSSFEENLEMILRGLIASPRGPGKSPPVHQLDRQDDGRR